MEYYTQVKPINGLPSKISGQEMRDSRSAEDILILEQLFSEAK